MAAFEFHRRRTRRWWYAGLAVVAASLFAVFYVAGAGAVLSGSTFEGNDGDLAVTTSGNSDWNSLSTAAAANPRLNIGVEQFTGQQDNSFGQGTKEDNSAVTLVQGSIPPNKSDLTSFYEASETGTNGHVMLYLAWERSNVLGSANMDFEINKQGTACMGSTTGFPVHCTINRSVGDVLVTYDFTNGGSTPAVGIRTWNGSSWIVDPTVVGDGQVNSGTVSDSHNGASLPANTFGEAEIDLTASGVLTSGSCDFGQATTFLKSRSSASFTAEIKDFVSPISTPINPCGTITVIKHTLDGAGTRGVDHSFGYTTTGTGLSAFSLNDSAGTDNTSNTKAFSGLGPGTYSVTETLPVSNFAFNDLTCTASGTGTTVTPSASPGGNSSATATVNLAFGGNVTCTYTNQQQVGAIRVSKTSTKASAALAGATFSVTGPNSFSTTLTTGSDGTACVGNLPFGSYSVTETGAPSGYKINDATAHAATVNASASCSDTGVSYTGDLLPFTDTPLSTITVGFHSLAGPGVTSATVQCTSESAAANLPEGDATKTLGNATSTLLPGTYSCTVVVDP